MQKFKIFIKKLHNNRGATLGEMLFCVAMVGLISLLVASGITFSYRKTAEISNEAYADDVSTVLHEKLSGLISQAIATGGKKVYISSDGNMIAFNEAESGPIIIYTYPESKSVIDNLSPKYDDAVSEYKPFNGLIDEKFNTGYINVYYSQLKTGEKMNPSSLWTFPEKTYMGLVISDLSFEPIRGHNGKLMITINLTLKRNDGLGTEYYKSTSTVCCYNINAPNNLNEVVEKDSKNGINKSFIFTYLNSVYQ